jgi:hypothetical protein
MITLADAFQTAVQMRGKLDTEASHVAAENADRCLSNSDIDGFKDWNRVCAMIRHLDLQEKMH